MIGVHRSVCDRFDFVKHSSTILTSGNHFKFHPHTDRSIWWNGSM